MFDTRSSSASAALPSYQVAQVTKLRGIPAARRASAALTRKHPKVHVSTTTAARSSLTRTQADP